MSVLFARVLVELIFCSLTVSVSWLELSLRIETRVRTIKWRQKKGERERGGRRRKGQRREVAVHVRVKSSKITAKADLCFR